MTVGRRLFLLVLLPLTVLTITLGVVADDRWSERQAAASVVSNVDDLRLLVALQSALYSERAAVEFELRSASLGVPSTIGAELLGVEEPAATFDATERAIAAAASAPLSIIALVDQARSLHAAGDPSVIDAYDGIDDVLLAQIAEELALMQDVAATTSDIELAAVLRTLESSVLAFSASTDQTTGLADSWFGDEEARTQALSSLGFQTARYELAISAIAPELVPTELRLSSTDRTDPVSLAALRTLSGGVDVPSEDNLEAFPFIIEVFQASFIRNAALIQLVAVSADDVERSAAGIADDAANAFMATLVLGGAAVVVSVLLSWRLAASIAGPIASVADRTRQLQAGQIEAAPLMLKGALELQDVAGAINDVSVNLGALEGKLDALAREDLEDSRLSQEVPGRLGETLTKSVDTLSSSIAERSKLQARLAHLANHDALTGLFNRVAVLDHLLRVLGRAEAEPFGLLFVDLDDFKRTNDVFGHGTGDAVLVEVARRLNDACRHGDIVARLGGDEFLVVCTGDLSGLLHTAERIIEVVSAPMHVESAGGLSIAPSIGIAAAESTDRRALDLLSRADAALHVAKASDGRIGVFDDGLRGKLELRANVEQRLHEALSGGEFEVHYQPVLRSGSLRVGQLEALVRWAGNETYGPDVFIPIAEQSDLVIAIDRFVLGTATRDLASMISGGAHADLCVAVNLSGRHLLHADVVAHVGEALADSQLDASRLIIEVTETALIIDLDRAAAHLRQLRAMGVRVSVDDFGTGFTSISQLRRLPVDELKIDRSLVSELPEEQALVRVVQDLALHFGMTIVAEGVETQEQADFLRNLGCTQLQGWLYARAMPTDELAHWFSARNEFENV